MYRLPRRLLTLAVLLPLLPLAARPASAAEPAPVPMLVVPGVNPAAPGEVPLANLAPAAADAPVDSAGSTPPAAPTPAVVPARQPDAPTLPVQPVRMQTGCSLRDYGAPVERGQIASAVFNTCAGVSLHKPNFILPLSYSPSFTGRESEFIFQLSGKAQLWDFGPGALYFGYSQRSYFQVFNEKKSKAFRESDYNPELFVRLPTPLGLLPNWSLDAGFEHESNGQDLPDSRSYNRVYAAPYWTHGRQAFQFKTWWRIPEDNDRADDDPSRDDNPDLGAYTGYAEFRYRRDFPWHNQLIDVAVRGNLNTGRGAVTADYSLEIGPVGALFVRVFNGYGESLIDYNHPITRLAVGIALQR
ncbi:MAG: phospholipase A [Stagnimonas sp.]|nr:phospholipase A [Stagnimonas sp.]